MTIAKRPTKISPAVQSADDWISQGTPSPTQPPMPVLAEATPKKRTQPKRKTPPKILRSYRLPELLLDRVAYVAEDVGLPDYTVVEMLLNEALKARGVPTNVPKRVKAGQGEASPE